MHFILAAIALILFLIIFFLRPDLRKVMIWSGSLSIPLFLLKFLIVPEFLTEISQLNLYFTYLLEALIFGFTFGGVAAVIFEVLFHKKLKTIPHPHRHHLNWLVFGPIVFGVSALIIRLPFSYSLGFGFLAQAIILIYLRKDLFWDSLISGVFLGLVYILFYYAYFTVIPGQLNVLWLSNLTGISMFGLPVEEIFAIFTFGLLWGPLYEGTKGYALKEE